MNTRGGTVPPVYHGYRPSDTREKNNRGAFGLPFFVGLNDKTDMKNGQSEEPRKGRRFHEKEDGPTVMEWYAVMPTAELAERMGLTVKQIKNYVYRENPELWARKDAATLSRINSEKGKKGGRPRRKRE